MLEVDLDTLRSMVTVAVEGLMDKSFTLDRLIAENISLPILVFEMIGSLIAYANPPLCYLTGYKESDIYKMKGFDLIPMAESERFQHILKEVIEGKEKQLKIELQNKYHTRVPVTMKLKLIQHTVDNEERSYIMAQVIG